MEGSRLRERDQVVTRTLKIESDIPKRTVEAFVRADQGYI